MEFYVYGLLFIFALIIAVVGYSLFSSKPQDSIDMLNQSGPSVQYKQINGGTNIPGMHYVKSKKHKQRR